MSASRPPPIRDFASLKNVWGTEGNEASRESSKPSVDIRRSTSIESTAATVQQHGSPNSEAEEPMSGSQLQLQLEQAKMLVADFANRQQYLEEQVSLLEQDLVSKDSLVELLKQDLGSSNEKLKGYAARDVELASLDKQIKALAEERAALASDRAVFERDLDELDDLKRRETEVAVRESSVKQAQEEIDRRKVEVDDLESLRSELDDKLRTAEAVLVDHKKLQSDLRAAKREIKKKSEETDALAAEVEQVKERLKKLQERHRILKTEHTEVQDQYATASQALEERTKELESIRSRMDRLRAERDQINALLALIPELNITSEALLQWLAQDGTPEYIGFDEDSQLGWSGVGSYDPDAFDRLLIELGIQQYALPHPSITHVVVGRIGWSKDDLLTQIDMRQGQTLRVYSQEMLLAALITGRDPLVCEDPEVLESFKKGHPALEFLAESDFEWPSFSSSDTSEIDEVGGESLRVTESPLHALGYKVGETSWLSRKQRQEILRDAFERQHLPWVESDAYMEKWGSARSHQRLWRIAYHLAMQLNGPGGRDWRKPKTRSDWQEDLEWLYEKFYQSRKFRFKWPHVAVA